MSSDNLQSRIGQLIIRWVFVLLPTAAIVDVTLTFLNFSYTAFNTGIVQQTIYFAVGLTIAYSLYFFRARWIFTFILLWIVYYFIAKVIVKLPGEFDVFYATARFELFSALFLLGWAFGFLLVRVRFSYIILVALLATATIVTISNTIDVSLTYILLHLAPVVVYGLYMLFLSPLMTGNVEMDLKKSLRLFLRFSFFLALTLLVFIFIQRFFQNDLKAVEKELAARGEKDKKGDGSSKKDKGYDQRYGLMDKPGNGDDGYRLKDTMKINSKMSQSDVLMFCSKLDNYFPNGAPKPLYFVYHYLTRYDPERETFTRDVNVPFFDEFDADPSKIEMYHSLEDDNIITNSLAQRKRMVVEAKVYLSSNTWKHSLLAPSSAFYVQSIPVEKDFQKTYYFAYKVKSYASDLNNAFFVYNPSASPILDKYQQQRIDELQTVGGYKGVDPVFLEYYTKLPRGPLYDSIRDISRRITTNAKSPIDKVVAVQDYFLQRDENGKRVFRYTLKPGGVDDPNIPTASMLGNFLFKTHAGYCTYYAGASLFMLRALGIPSRFTTGFATINRNDKNKGWYWFYASQAHAWTQVYFPGYGWLDFDMTIGNEDQQEAPRPDGTPPLPPPEPWLVLNSKLESTPDPKTKQLEVSFDRLIYFDQGYQLQKINKRSIDASRSRILYDKRDTTFACIQPGDSLVVVSFKDEVKRIPAPRPGVSIDVQLDGFPRPIIADEIHIKPRPKASKKDQRKKEQKQSEEKPMTWQEILILSGKIAASVIILIFLLPFIYLIFLLVRRGFAKDTSGRADAVYSAALYQFHMAGVERYNETPLNYAKMKTDPFFQAGFEEFMKVYLRLKYSKEKSLPEDDEVIERFAKKVGPAIRRKTGFFTLLGHYFNILLASRYFLRSENPDDLI
jgi:transglutaminase-like putative cysteine protease